MGVTYKLFIGMKGGNMHKPKFYTPEIEYKISRQVVILLKDIKGSLPFIEGSNKNASFEVVFSPPKAWSIGLNILIS